MTQYHYSNTSVQTVLASPALAGDGTIIIGDATGLPASTPYSVIIDYQTAAVEVVTVTSASGTTLTVTRGQDGTSAQSHNLNAVVVHGCVARDLQAPQDHIAASTNVHGIGASAVVGTDTVQTLTNKTISGASNTVSNIGDSSITGLSASKLTGNFNGGSNFVSAADATVPLTSTGTGTATANLFEAFKGAAKQCFITAAGAISAVAGITAGTTVAAGTSVSAGTSVTATTGVTAGTTVTGQGTGDVVGLLADVPNANVSDLLQLKRNSTVKAKVDKDGNLTAVAGTFSGAVATGPLTVTGAASTTTTATVGTNLAVNGTSTLTGAVSAGGDINVVGNVKSNGETWHGATLQNNFTNRGAGFPSLSYQLVASPPNGVQITGQIVSGTTTTSGTTIATLPGGYHPTSEIPIAAINSSTFAPIACAIQTDGQIKIYGTWVNGNVIQINGVIPLNL